jgi:hypothetical protein
VTGYDTTPTPEDLKWARESLGRFDGRDYTSDERHLYELAYALGTARVALERVTVTDPYEAGFVRRARAVHDHLQENR